ncbi:PREDICTED: centromere protein J-like [Dipodomys ordii]|uniref:Centromere protein J-like n=1 Tax=Dipodomys ordii TaxID=10020 RepID=A0A1S3FTS6_DIPOR|nr:PREDICTED: centromere protein J-like [Dipodomys ordii]
MSSQESAAGWGLQRVGVLTGHPGPTEPAELSRAEDPRPAAVAERKKPATKARVPWEEGPAQELLVRTVPWRSVKQATETRSHATVIARKAQSPQFTRPLLDGGRRVSSRSPRWALAGSAWRCPRGGTRGCPRGGVRGAVSEGRCLRGARPSPPQRLQKLVCQLQGELRAQASRWSAAHRRLQSQMDVLASQNLELREALRGLGLQLLQASEAPPAPVPTGQSSPRVAHAPPPVLRKPRGGQWPAPASRLPPEEAVAAAVQNGPAALRGVTIVAGAEGSVAALPPTPRHLRALAAPQEGKAKLSDTCSPISEGSEDRLLDLAPVLAGEFPDSVPRDTELQTLPVSPGPSSEPVDQVTTAPEKEKTQEKQHPRGKVEQVLSDGRTIITFPNGTRKEISADKKTTLIRFFNGDMKKIKPDQRVVYYYADAQTTHTTFPNGMEIVQFPNKRTEKFHPDGSKETVFPDGTVTRLRGGCEETVFPDGTVVCVQRNGDRTITFSNGQKEIHTAHFKRREFPDGTSKTVYGSGCRESEHASGRLKARGQTGSVIPDRKAQPPADKHC